MKKTKKIALIIAVLMLMAVCFAFGVSALDATGQCGDNATYTFDSATGELVISGTGAIEERVFNAINEIKNVIIEDGITEIGARAFSHCYRLESVNIPNSVTKLAEESFAYCYNLSDVVIPDGATEVATNAFGLCCNMSVIYISDSVKNIGDIAFVNMPFLEKVVIESMDVNIGIYNWANQMIINGVSREAFIDLFIRQQQNSSDEELQEELNKYLSYVEDEVFLCPGTIYCHSGSSAEAYAIEYGFDYVLTHFFKGEWTYDYDNMVRTRKCIHCDELQVEELEIEEITGDNFLVVEETVTNGIEGNVEVLKAFDINLKNSDGVYVQPDGTIKVKLPNDWSKNGTYKVYRVNDDGTLTDMNAYREGSHLVFDTDHFSIYVIVVEGVTEEEPETPAEPDTTECDCICHATGFLNRILAIVYKIFLKLLDTSPLCECGVAHY